MKKTWVIVVNVLIMVAMLTFVVIYSGIESRNTTQVQIEHFENTTITMRHVTENYLEGEQRICDVWARYINSNDLTIEDAVSFIRISHVLPNASAHIVYVDTLSGLSTKARQTTSSDYSVSYSQLNLLNDLRWISGIGESTNITRAYTNPVNGEQSIAFCNLIRLHDPETGSSRAAVLLRVLPIEELEEKWFFPKEEFKSAELSIIDNDGDYIIKGHSFKNSNIFEFYRSYNVIDSSSAQELFRRITSTTGSVTMKNSRGEQCILAFTPVAATEGWTLVSFMPMEDLSVNTENWLLIGFVSAGLLILFVFDLAVMLIFNKKLKATAREAASASKAKTDFLSTMSHDIRTPMNAIIGLTAISEKNIEDTEAVKENLRKITLASNHLLTLINDILDISKVESGKLNLSPQTFSISEMMENIVNISEPMIKDKNIDFDLHVGKLDAEYIYADKLRLNQIYINILSNAIKYTEPGGRVRLDMKEEKSERSGCVKLTYVVSDSGIGMSPEFMQTMYQPFSRETDSRVDRIQGTGLGLAITKKMVDLLGGVIECQSEQGKGTTFTVILDLPVADTQEADGNPEKENESLNLQGMNILVAEDNDINWEIISTVLDMYGITSERAENGRICVEKMKSASEGSYDLIFMDIQMPQMNGLDATRAIRALDDSWASSIPIIAMTADAFSENITECLNAGMNGHIAKPIDINLVMKEIRKIKEEREK
ncbi:MAG: response regulator [Spirochaetales bacterium]|nr:response regulator [Spirochaetales bacterium]